MFETFNITSLFLGVLIAVPLVMGSLLLLSSLMRPDYPTKVQKVAGCLFLADALYLMVRTYLWVNKDMCLESEHIVYYITDCAIITILGVVPYFVIVKKWMRQQPTHIPEPDSITLVPKAEKKGEGKRLAYASIHKALTEKCVGEKLYLNRDISLYSLARVCGTNRTYLTDYLHEEQHQTFYEYINTLRLVHVDELLEKSKLSQEAIALQCGFNSAQTMRNVYMKLRGKALNRYEGNDR